MFQSDFHFNKLYIVSCH